MKILIYDTETTGLIPGNICQLSYIVKDSEAISAKNFYFKVSYVEPGAQRVHGLSVKMLDKLSNNKRFADACNEIKSDFEAADIVVSHNYDFDNRFLAAEFSKCNQTVKLKNGFCTMKYFTPICKIQGKRAGYKYPRLEELAHYFNVNDKEIEKRNKVPLKY